jgi:hypothetical protein
MTAATLRFHCPQCHARIKAPVQLNGRARNCPGCGHQLIVPAVVLGDDADAVLVPLEEQDRFVLGLASRTGVAVPLPRAYSTAARTHCA